MSLPMITLSQEHRDGIGQWAIEVGFPQNVFVPSMGWGNSRRVKFELIWSHKHGREITRIEATIKAGRLVLPTSRELETDYGLMI